MIQIHGSDHPEYKIDQASSGDDFDKWCSDRDGQITNVQAAQPAGQPGEQEEPTYVGSSDLDAYGQWNEVPDQGWCWTPQVDAGWVPYTYGRWGYEPYFGWTWISFEPWGWAPYHYGSWFSYGGRWHWRPDRGHGHDRGGFGDRGAFYGGRRYGGSHFNPRGSINGQPGGRLPAYAAHSTFVGATGRMGFGASVNTWHGYSRGNQIGRGSVPGYGSGRGFQGRGAPGARGNQNGWQRYASPSPYGGGRQSWSNQPRSYPGGGYGGGSRPPLELNRPIMRQRAPNSGGYGGGRTNASPSGGTYGGGRTYSPPSGGSYGGGRSYSPPAGGGRTYSPPSGGGRSYSPPSGGGRTYSPPSGGGRTYSAPSGGGRTYSAPSGGGRGFGGGGGGGGHSSGGGGHGGGHR